MFVSTVYSDYFPGSKWKPYLWYGSLLTASTIGFLRFESGKHFPSDVLAGAAVGSAIGYTIPWLHRKEHGNLTLNSSASGCWQVRFCLRF